MSDTPTPAPTPETDKEEGKAIDYVNFDGDETLLVPSKFARNLERQRDEAVAKLEEAKRLAAEGRLAGRQEAVAILIRLGPEELNEFAENAPLADSGDYDCYFNEEKLRDALDAHTGTMSSKLDELEDAYWEVLSKCDEIQQERDALKAEVEALSKRSRVMGCGYCGCEVFEFPSNEPSPEDCERALTLFAEHDRACQKNPLAAEVERLKADKERLDWLEKQGMIGIGHVKWGEYGIYAGGVFSPIRQAIDAERCREEIQSLLCKQ